MLKRQAIAVLVLVCFNGDPALAILDPAIVIDVPPPDEPVRFYTGYSLAHDSNLLRATEDEGEASDTLHRLDVGVELKLKLNRQLATVRLDASRNEFERFTQLDYDGRDLLGRLDWLVGNRWHGDISYSNTRTLNKLTELQSPTRDLLTQQRGFANALYRLDPTWSISGGLEYFELEHSATGQEVFDRREDAINLNLHYLNAVKNKLALQIKAIDGQLPEREFQPGVVIDNDYRQFELGAIADWYLTGKTLLRGGIGYTQRNYREMADRDIDGVTGRLTLHWFATAKTEIAFTGLREISAVEDFTAAYALTSGVSVAPLWTPTEKIRVEGDFYYQERDFEGEVASEDAQRRDEVHGANLSLSYTPREKIRLAVMAQTEKRDSNRESKDYRYNIVGVSVRIEFY